MYSSLPFLEEKYTGKLSELDMGVKSRVQRETGVGFQRSCANCFKENRVYFGLQFEGTVIHGRKDTVARAGDEWSGSREVRA